MAHLKTCMETEIEPIKKAGLIPTPSHIEQFTAHLERYDMKEMELYQTLRKFSDMATLQGDFFMCKKNQMEIVSKCKELSLLFLVHIYVHKLTLIASLTGLTNIQLDTASKFALCMSPV